MSRHDVFARDIVASNKMQHMEHTVACNKKQHMEHSVACNKMQHK